MLEPILSCRFLGTMPIKGKLSTRTLQTHLWMIAVCLYYYIRSALGSESSCGPSARDGVRLDKEVFFLLRNGDWFFPSPSSSSSIYDSTTSSILLRWRWRRRRALKSLPPPSPPCVKKGREPRRQIWIMREWGKRLLCSM